MWSINVINQVIYGANDKNKNNKETLWIFLSKHYISIEIQLIWSLRRSTCYHKTHLSLRFMFDPAGQLYALTKSSELDRGPMIRYFPGECGLLSTWSKSFSIVIFSHHVYKNVVMSDHNSMLLYFKFDVLRLANILIELITWAKLMKRSCSEVYSWRPGSFGSGLPSFTLAMKFWYALKLSLSPPLSAIFSPRVLAPFS